MQFGFQSGVERPLKMHFNHIMLKLSSPLLGPPQNMWLSVRVVLSLLMCIPVKDGSNTCAVSAVPVDMQAGGQ